MELGLWEPSCTRLPDNRNQMCDLVRGGRKVIATCRLGCGCGVCSLHPGGCPVTSKVAAGGSGRPEGLPRMLKAQGQPAVGALWAKEGFWGRQQYQGGSGQRGGHEMKGQVSGWDSGWGQRGLWTPLQVVLRMHFPLRSLVPTAGRRQRAGGLPGEGQREAGCGLRALWYSFQGLWACPAWLWVSRPLNPSILHVESWVPLACPLHRAATSRTSRPHPREL